MLSFLWFLIASVNVYVPKDRVTNSHQGYGFIEFRSEEDADYVSVALSMFCEEFSDFFLGTMVTLFLCFVQAIKVLNMIKLHGKPIRVNKVSNCFFYFDYLPSYLFFSCEFSRFRTLTDGFCEF